VFALCQGRSGSAAYRVDVREEEAKSAQNHELYGVQISSMLPVRKEEAMGPSMIANPPGYAFADSPHLRTDDSIPTYTRTS
jgi:hypothetical protein